MKDRLQQNKTSRFTLNLPEMMRAELEQKAEMDFISLNSAIVMRLAKCLREEKAATMQNQEAA
ncbi:hypothetical protein B4P00_20040 [Shewanella xiamenensis]|jgi:hypothetical protein|uniref:Arc family DNA-binding protein n=1 Tax=Shewanella xiamenensis TaxID=332186 RepID=UPI001C4E14B3|nr:Arc family DNA-binding protein [Shewanella xiamenensis]MBW0298480.1 hypothetical protein [Shewanella xiamenensis]